MHRAIVRPAVLLAALVAAAAAAVDLRAGYDALTPSYLALGAEHLQPRAHP